MSKWDKSLQMYSIGLHWWQLVESIRRMRCVDAKRKSLHFHQCRWQFDWMLPFDPLHPHSVPKCPNSVHAERYPSRTVEIVFPVQFFCPRRNQKKKSKHEKREEKKSKVENPGHNIVHIAHTKTTGYMLGASIGNACLPACMHTCACMLRADSRRRRGGGRRSL